MIGFEIKKTIRSKAIKLVLAAAAVFCIITAFYSIKKADKVYLSSDDIQTNYVKQTSYYIDTAERNLKELYRIGAAENDYSVVYYKEIIRIYSDAKDSLTVKGHSENGWNTFLQQDSVFIACLFVSGIIGAYFFYEERRTGSAVIIRSSPKGRSAAAVSKLISAMIITSIFCLLLTLITVGFYMITDSLGNPFSSLQTAPDFCYSPWRISIAEAVLIQFGQRLLICFVTCLLFAFFSLILNLYVAIFSVGLIPVIAEFSLFTIRYSAVDVFAKNVNFFAAGSGYLLKRYYSVHLFGCSDARAVNLSLSFLLLILLGLITVILFRNKKATTVITGFSPANKIRSVLFSKKRRSKLQLRSLTGWEYKKVFSRIGITAVVVLAILFRLFYYGKTLPVKKTVSEQLYKEYCNKFSGMNIDTINAPLSEEETRIYNGLKNRDIIENGSLSENYTEEERNLIVTEYGYAKARYPMIEQFRNRIAELKTLSKEACSNGVIMYDSGYNKLFTTDADVVLIMLIVLVSSGLFSKEKELNSEIIIHTSPSGRCRTFRAKFTVSLGFTAITFLLFSVYDFLLLLFSSGLGNFDYAAISVKAATVSVGALSVGQYLIILYTTRLAAYLTFALLVTSVSCLSGNTLSAIGISSAICFMPLFIRILSQMPAIADISAFMSANCILLSAGPSGILFIIPLSVITVCLTFLSYKLFTKNGKGVPLLNGINSRKNQ